MLDADGLLKIFAVDLESGKDAMSYKELSSKLAIEKFRVLVADDEFELAEMVKELISVHFAVEVTCVGGVGEALAYLENGDSQNKKFDLLVSDFHFKDTTANRLLSHLSRHEIEIPVVLMTGAESISLEPYPLLFGVFAKPDLSGLVAMLSFLNLRPLHHAD